ncbi:anhydro-N-acetylmuramic acid kinase [Ignatzschineria ureiclastica]|uniref:Anhydro-N-acetylmuramic acid kinase n=1 Tax=Ignatzschineria ureiclastica TaxID=472582 RepID=A0A2U2AHI9_9GAMM|nr:anhydro-N-acetylmuramic acid kinase AnmK [Ignatzschineria ureiclastica]PWD82100.1 anhydro-N-acetylmuramic acid kinase [Ignatzschineria ureiclastica]GGZ92633.1 anhydro-N-acetylmuramic acid kinase [Ignatzschineria ureiclastica]
MSQSLSQPLSQPLSQSLPKSLFAVGIMTGTSLDGVDVALVKLEGKGADITCQLLHFYSQPLEDDLRHKITQACDLGQSNVALICTLNAELGLLYADAVDALLVEVEALKRAGAQSLQEFSGKLDFIASHGQTIYHLPRSQSATHQLTPSTLQIGDPSMLAYRFATDVYFNFRMMDVIAGGDGAPLVPMTEWLLYRSATANRLLQNIGGIGNVTILPKEADIEDLWAFDTGPGNMMINEAMQQLYQKSYDHNGEIARQGELIEPLWQQLCQHPYLAENPPKSTGREQFGARFTQALLQQYLPPQNCAYSPADIIHTLTRFTAFSIADSYRRFVFPAIDIDEVIVGGGGAYNSALLRYLQAELPDQQILTGEDLGLSSDAKEAIAFALLGYLTREKLAGNVPRATGARESLVLGQLCPNPFPKREK